MRTINLDALTWTRNAKWLDCIRFRSKAPLIKDQTDPVGAAAQATLPPAVEGAIVIRPAPAAWRGGQAHHRRKIAATPRPTPRAWTPQAMGEWCEDFWSRAKKLASALRGAGRRNG